MIIRLASNEITFSESFDMMLQINYNAPENLNLNDEWVNRDDVMCLLNVKCKIADGLLPFSCIYYLRLGLFILLISMIKKLQGDNIPFQ